MGLFKKIDDKLGSNSRDHLNEIREGFKFDPGPRWGLEPEETEISCSLDQLKNH